MKGEHTKWIFLVLMVGSFKCVSSTNKTVVCPRERIGGSVEVYGCECYQFVKQQKTWSQAKFSCEERGGRLVKVTADKQRRWLSGKVSSFLSGDSGVWIGLSRVGGRWKWEGGGTADSYQNWAQDEPEGKIDLVVTSVKQECVYMKKLRSWRWADYQCWGKWYYVCQYDVTEKGRCDLAEGFSSDSGEGRGFTTTTEIKQWYEGGSILSTAQIIGITVGGIFALIILTIVAACVKSCVKACLEERKKKREVTRAAMPNQIVYSRERRDSDGLLPPGAVGGAVTFSRGDNSRIRGDSFDSLSSEPLTPSRGASGGSRELHVKELMAANNGSMPGTSSSKNPEGRCRGGGVVTKVKDEQGMRLVVVGDEESEGEEDPPPPPQYDEDMRLEYETQIKPALDEADQADRHGKTRGGVV